jgi:hypothetical protein
MLLRNAWYIAAWADETAATSRWRAGSAMNRSWCFATAAAVSQR